MALTPPSAGARSKKNVLLDGNGYMVSNCYVKSLAENLYYRIGEDGVWDETGDTYTPKPGKNTLFIKINKKRGYITPWDGVTYSAARSKTRPLTATHRLGQTKTVTVYKLIMKDSIEEKILKLQEAKKDLADEILKGENGNLGSLSQEELRELIG